MEPFATRFRQRQSTAQQLTAQFANVSRFIFLKKNASKQALSFFENKMPLKIVGMVYTGPSSTEGNFGWMLQQPQYKNALFLFMDNWLDSQDSVACAGSGTARYRPLSYNFVEGRPRTAGIPTGWSSRRGGFQTSNKMTNVAINIAFGRIKCILVEYQDEIDTIVFSCDQNDHSNIGTNTFRVNENVIQIISRKIQDLGSFDQTIDLEHSQSMLDDAENSLKHKVIEQYDRENTELKTELRKLKAENVELTKFQSKREKEGSSSSCFTQLKLGRFDV